MKPLPRRFPFNPNLTSWAQKLRRKSTLSEVLLWRCLNRRQRAGYDFHRQIPIDEYILDFFAPALRLAIEIDGSSHKLKGTADDARQHRLVSLGIRFLRFEDIAVKRNLDGVVAEIDRWIATNGPSCCLPPHPALRAPLSRGDLG